MRNPLVSIVLPTFNRKNFVIEAIKSVLEQSYSNFELIIVDDGSTDSTGKIINNEFVDTRIKYTYQKNQGVSSARNLGLSMAAGDYLTFLDSDDLYEPTKVEKQLYVFNNLNFHGLCHSWYSKFDKNSGFFGIRKVNFFHGTIYPELLFYWMHAIAMPSVMIPRKIFEDVGGFEETLTHYEDYDWWRRIARKYPFYIINEPLVKIRKHESNVSSENKIIIPAAHQYLQIAFDQDNSLSYFQKRRAMGLMYGHAGRIYLANHQNKSMPELREYSIKSIKYYPFQLFPYIVLLLSFLDLETRAKLNKIRRRILYKNK